MTPAALIERVTADGLVVTLTSSGSIRITGDAMAVQRWTPVLRDRKSEVVAALQTAPWWHWLVRFSDRDPLDVAFGSYVTADGVLAEYPEAASAEPIWPAPSRPVTADERAELKKLIAGVLTSEVDRDEALALALSAPDSGLICWRALAAERRSPHA